MSELNYAKYLQWKKNVPLLYSQLQTSTLIWPSLSLDWLPDVEHGKFDQHRLLLGSFSNSQIAHETILLNTVEILNDIPSLPDTNYSTTTNEFEYNVPFINNKGEPNNSITNIQSITHISDPNRIRHNPHNPDLIATATSSGLIKIFDRTKKATQSTETVELADIILSHHTCESWTLDWNQHNSLLATAANDGLIAIWDINKQFKIPERLPTARRQYAPLTINSPLESTTAHDFGVNEVKWIPNHNNILTSSGEDGIFKLVDLRSPESHTFKIKISDNALNCHDINPHNTFEIALGSSTGNLNFIDIRIPNEINVIKSHTDGVTSIKYSPYILSTKNGPQSVVASSSADSTVKFTASGKSQPESIFSHEGHLLEVNEVSWSSHKGLLASCSADNSVHIYAPML
ncbi:Msi1 protein [Martiniozyma asiatica (nom. inval.)]|nr:Msi1 protein [Martiniozyma asiatica]